MSQQVEITAVGGLVRPADSDRYRPFTRGDRVLVSDEEAQRLVGQAAAVIVDPGAPAENAESEQPQPGAIPVSDLDLAEGGTSVAELRKFANARRINLHGATRRPEIVESIEAALTDPDTGGDE